MGIDPVSFLIYVAVVVLATLAAKYFMTKDDSPSRQKQKPTTLTERGAYTPYIIGRRRVGPIFAWAGLRKWYKTNSGQVMNFTEEGWHVICLGPASTLWRIYEAGKVIFSGPINPQSHPSGTIVTRTGGRGRFSIYWGEETQPVNTRLGAATRIGINSRWPFVCYVHWHPKELGTSVFWPVIEYEIECPVQNPVLVNSSAHKAGTYNLNAKTYNINNAVGAGPPAFFDTPGQHEKVFRPGRRLRINAPNPAAGEYTIFNSVQVLVGLGPGFRLLYTTTVTLNEAAPGINNTGTAQVYDDPTDDGYNPAHMLHQILFDQWPHGLELSRSQFSIPSMEEAGVTLENEGFPGHLLVQSGEEVGSVIAAIDQDIGAFIPFDVVLGLYRLHLLRAETNILALPEETILNPFPERENLLRDAPITAISFVFMDRSRKFVESTISDDDDGMANQLLHKKQGKADLRLITDFAMAVPVVERRKQEEHAQGAAVKVIANRGARLIFAGQVITVPDVDYPLRVSEVKCDLMSGKVELLCFTDFYGVAVTDYEQDPGAIETPEEDEEDSPSDEAVDVVEPPPVTIPPEGNEQGAFFPSSTIPVMPLRIRTEGGSPLARVHLSDGDTFAESQVSVPYVTGGELSAAYPYMSELDEEGFTFTELGVDFLSLMDDLSGNENLWRLGQQICICEKEWMFVRAFEMTGIGTWKARGVLRGRLGSEPVEHPEDAVVYVLKNTDLQFFKHLLVQAGTTVQFKMQTDGGDLDATPIVEKDLSLITPRAPVGLRKTDGLLRYDAGDDLALKWGYFHAMEANVGAGMQMLGTPVPTPTPNGSFVLEIWDPAGPTMLRQVSCIKQASYTYTNELMVEDFGGEPTEVLFKLRQVVGSAQSPQATLTLEKR